MAEERLEASAASEQAAGNFASGESSPWGKERGNRAFRIITLIDPAPSVDRVLPLPFHGQRGQHVQLFRS